MKYAASVIGILCFVLSSGCSTSHNARLLLPDNRDALLSSAPNIVKGTVVEAHGNQELTAGEQMEIGSPARPQNGFKYDFVIAVDSVVKGNFFGTDIRLKGVEDPNQTALLTSQLRLGKNQKVYVGWQSESGGNYEGLMIVNAEIAPPATAP